jgi:hypothetical protein
VAQTPVAANHAPVGDVTNTIGATHGEGSVIVASMSASPAGDAGKSAVAMFETAALPPSIVWQATIALNDGIVFVPSFGPAAKTRPSTSTCKRPSARRSTLPEASRYGSPRR